jgi:hypothetical protein
MPGTVQAGHTGVAQAGRAGVVPLGRGGFGPLDFDLFFHFSNIQILTNSKIYVGFI